MSIKLKNTLLLLNFLLFAGLIQAQHVEQVANVNFGIPGNDCWGYIDSNGTEYAIMGLQDKAAIYSLEDPAYPRLIGNFPGSSSIWRDIKTWKNYIYVVTEAHDGILIINMKDTSNITSKFVKPMIPHDGMTEPLVKAHNIYIDEHGFAYIAGSNISNGGVVILDLNADPENPQFAGIESKAYAHDVVTQRDTMFTSDIYDGVLSIYDVHDKTHPVLLGQHSTTSNFTHNAWPSMDGHYVFTTDERSEGRLDAYDISDMTNIRRLDTYKSKDGMNRGVIPHNTHYKNGFLITSWYSDGVIIIDAHRPDNLVEVGRFETFHGSSVGFSGCWGAFPFFPSGLILASDRQEGLYVLKPEYQRACYLEGKITEKGTGKAIQSVEIRIEAQQDNFEQSNIEGDYKTGLGDAGSYTVHFTHPDYFPVSVNNVELNHGELKILDIEMEKLEQQTLSGIVIDKETQQPIPNAWVLLSSSVRESFNITDKDGRFETSIIAQNLEGFQLAAGKWGYLHNTISLADGQNDISIALEKGYQDDFAADQGWSENSNAQTGIWELGIPVGGGTAGPPSDVPNDIGRGCYVTGNTGTGVGDDDIDGGTTTLTSPEMNLSNYKRPYINLEYWFVNFGGNTPPNDSLKLYILSGGERINVFETQNSIEEWQALELDIKAFVQGDLSSIRLELVAGDYDPGHVVEAGLDKFLVRDSFKTRTNNLKPLGATILFPNPAHNRLAIRTTASIGGSYYDLSISDISGRVWYETVKLSSKALASGVDIKTLQPGIYLLHLKDRTGQQQVFRFVKAR